MLFGLNVCCLSLGRWLFAHALLCYYITAPHLLKKKRPFFKKNPGYIIKKGPHFKGKNYQVMADM